MKIVSLSSGSSGNCVYIETEKSKVLVDAGFSGRQIELLLKRIGVDPRELNAIFVTHEHIDHVAGVGVMSRRFKIPIYANERTWLAMRKRIGKIMPNYINVIKNNIPVNIRDFDMIPFTVFHDAADPLGFVFLQGNQKISVLTDTGIINDHMKSIITGSDAFYLESNYDLEMLKIGPYPPALKERILSQHGHMDNVETANILTDILRGEQEKIILAHLSEENNLPQLAHSTVNNILLEDGLDTSRDIELVVANRHEPTEIYDLNDWIK